MSERCKIGRERHNLLGRFRKPRCKPQKTLQRIGDALDLLQSTIPRNFANDRQKRINRGNHLCVGNHSSIASKRSAEEFGKRVVCVQRILDLAQVRAEHICPKTVDWSAKNVGKVNVRSTTVEPRHCSLGKSTNEPALIYIETVRASLPNVCGERVGPTENEKSANISSWSICAGSGGSGIVADAATVPAAVAAAARRSVNSFVKKRDIKANQDQRLPTVQRKLWRLLGSRVWLCTSVATHRRRAHDLF